MTQLLLSTCRFSRIAALAAVLLAVGLAIRPAAAQTTTQTPEPTVPTFQTTPAQTQAAPVTPAAAVPAAQVPAAQVPILLGLLDSGAILNLSSVGKSLNQQWSASLKALDEDTSKKEDALRAQAQALEQQRVANQVTPADYAAKRQAIQQQDQLLQQNYDKGKQALGQRLDKARATIAASARKVVQDVAKQRNLTLVLDRSAAHLFAPQWDITDDVMQRLNKSLPNIKL
ncbi:MAG TPA: OmpH family outer membrane protein [Candidatus Binatia bacterium]|nr:OmpH family outer membrane protein [Candidatus Binatia bacterium]